MDEKYIIDFYKGNHVYFDGLLYYIKVNGKCIAIDYNNIKNK